MGISFSVPCDPCINKISQRLDEKVGYIHNLEKNLEILKKTMEDLTGKQEDLSRRLKREEDRGIQKLSEFNLWLTRVESKKKKVNDLLSDRDDELQKLCLCGFCSKSLIASYRYGKKVFLMIREVLELKIIDFDKIADQTSEVRERPIQAIKKVEKLKSKVLEVIGEQAQSSGVEERQLQSIIVGQETMLEKAWQHLMRDDVGTMGMYGMGGVGKTTLLTQINNKFSKDKCGFDFVIWVVVAKELQLEKIQDEIAKKVVLGDNEWNEKDENEKALHLFNFLRKKRFVLLLDDIWEKVDLAKIGVPDPRSQKGCKVAFTTRSQDVCSHMGVEDPMEVQCLADNEAFDLFQKKVGQVTLESDPGIPNLARKVSKKCYGLPLALNVIGETMSSKRTIHEWCHAIDVLNSYAAEFSGMEDKILPLLKYSYDSLEEDYVKSYLLCCSLFPEDAKICKETLIDYWMSEWIIDESEGIKKAENKGYAIIGNLVRASLLMEVVYPNGEGYVSMHDVVREMALWIASDLGNQKEAFIVRAGVKLSKFPEVKNWKVVRKMSLMHNKIRHIDVSPECLELTTLLLQEANLSNISSEFFKSMPKLAVLDLSSNKFLSKLPNRISNLISLQYLNLACTAIRRFPKSLHKLKKLIHLDLEYTRELESIAGISRLQNLKVLKLFGSGFIWDLNTVKELDALEHL